MATTSELQAVLVRILVIGATVAAVAAATLGATAASSQETTILAPSSASTSVNVGSTWHDM
jgi:hypothetical protein